MTTVYTQSDYTPSLLRYYCTHRIKSNGTQQPTSEDVERLFSLYYTTDGSPCPNCHSPEAEIKEEEKLEEKTENEKKLEVKEKARLQAVGMV